MPCRWPIAAAILASLLASQPSRACTISRPLKLQYLEHADAVFVGRVLNYRIVSDQEVRTGYHALIEFQVDEMLVGEAPKRLTVTWDNPTGRLPMSLPSGALLVALHKPGSSAPPPYGPSATVAPSRVPESMSVLQPPCAPAFMFESTSEEAKAIRQMLGGRPG